VVRNRFDRKIADFVVCECGTLNVVALIELDDRSHVAAADRQRDSITKTAGYHTFRFQSRQKPTEAEISAPLDEAGEGSSHKRSFLRRPISTFVYSCSSLRQVVSQVCLTINVSPLPIAMS
jgi:hypothetical protein